MSDVSAPQAIVRETGKIKFFDSRKGFGFILPDIIIAVRVISGFPGFLKPFAFG